MWGFHWICWCFHLSYLDVSWNLLIYTNCHAVKLCSPVDLEIHQKIYMYRSEAYTDRQRNHWTNCSRYVQRSLRTFEIMAEDECQFLIGQTLVCLHLLLPADLREVCEKTNSQEVRYQLSLISFHHVLTMFLSLPQCPDFQMLHTRRRGHF